MARAVFNRSPAMAASAALHAALLVAVLVSWPWLAKPLHVGDVVPVTLMTSADLPAAKPAIAAPEPAPAATEAPVAQASPQMAAPDETPTPSPPARKAEPHPTPKPAPQTAQAAPQPAPTPHKPVSTKPATKPAPDVDWTQLAANLTHQARPSGPHQSSAAHGPPRPEQAVQARTTAGVSDAAASAALSSLAGELQRLWNPNCEAQGAAGVTIKVTFQLGSSGRLIGSPVSSQAGSGDAVVKAASDRAVRAVYQGEPFSDLPPALYGQRITVNFNPKSFCQNG